MKLVIMGLKNSGKTSLIQHVFLGKEWEEIENLKPTEFLETRNYKYRNLLEIVSFDLGGQKQFIEEYYTESWSSKIFSRIDIFLFILDSSNSLEFELAILEFWRAFQIVTRYNPSCLIYVIATKNDIKKLTLKQIENKLKKGHELIWEKAKIQIYSSSIPKNTARKTLGQILDNIIRNEKVLKGKQTRLQNLCDQFNKKTKTDACILINKDDGLEIASASKSKYLTSEELEYVCLKALVEAEKEKEEVFSHMKKIGFLSSDETDIRFWRSKDNDCIILADITPQVAFFSVVNAKKFSLGIMILNLKNLEAEVSAIL